MRRRRLHIPKIYLKNIDNCYSLLWAVKLALVELIKMSIFLKNKSWSSTQLPMTHEFLNTRKNQKEYGHDSHFIGPFCDRSKEGFCVGHDVFARYF